MIIRPVAALAAVALVLGVGVSLRPRVPHLPAQAQGDRELISQVRGLDPPGRKMAVVSIDAGRVRTAYWSADAHTKFEVGSVSKAITGLAINDAVGKGELSLDDPLGTHLDVGTEEVSKLPLRELVTHSSGLPPLATGGVADFARSWWASVTGANPYREDRAELLSRAATITPGDKEPEYSNLGAALAGQAGAAAAGQPYEEWITAKVFEPLALGETSVQTTTAVVEPGLDLAGRSQQPWTLGGYAPAGAIVSTPADLTTLAQALLDGRAPGQGALDPIADYDEDSRIGTFWFTSTTKNGGSYTWHNGATGGYSSFFGVDRQSGRAVIVLSDVHGASDLGIDLIKKGARA